MLPPTSWILCLYGEIIHLYRRIWAVTCESHNVIFPIIDLLKKFSDWVVHSSHVVHHKHVPVHLAETMEINRDCSHFRFNRKTFKLQITVGHHPAATQE